MRLYEAIVIAVEAQRNCEAGGNDEWTHRWIKRLLFIRENLLPSGSGFDAGTTIDNYATNAKRIVLETSFHHMDSHGVYDGWTDHTIRITPNLSRRFDMTISGRNRNDIKSYIADAFQWSLDSEVTWEQLDGETALSD